MRSTHTYAVLLVSRAAFDDVYARLKAAAPDSAWPEYEREYVQKDSEYGTVLSFGPIGLAIDPEDDTRPRARIGESERLVLVGRQLAIDGAPIVPSVTTQAENGVVHALGYLDREAVLDLAARLAYEDLEQAAIVIPPGVHECPDCGGTPAEIYLDVCGERRPKRVECLMALGGRHAWERGTMLAPEPAQIGQLYGSGGAPSVVASISIALLLIGGLLAALIIR